MEVIIKQQCNTLVALIACECGKTLALDTCHSHRAATVICVALARITQTFKHTNFIMSNFGRSPGFSLLVQ